MKKIFTLFLIFSFSLSSVAVLKEKDLARTLGVLRAELEQTYNWQQAEMARLTKMHEQQHDKLVEYMQSAEKISLMLYSQQQDFTFDVSYACQEATKLYDQLNENNVPYQRIADRIQVEVDRYEGLIASLEDLPPIIGHAKALNDSLSMEICDSMQMMSDSTFVPVLDSLKAKQDDLEKSVYLLNEEQQKDRAECVRIARALRDNLIKIREAIVADEQSYTLVNAKVKQLNDYAETRYMMMQESIFKNGDKNYFQVLMSLPAMIGQVKTELSGKYGHFRHHTMNYSEWRGPIVYFICLIILIYITLATLLSNLLVRGFVPFVVRRTKHEIQDIWGGIFVGAKRGTLISALGMFIFAVSLMIVHYAFASNHFVVMATKIAANIAWLSLAIYVSLIVRLEEGELKAARKLYMPFLCMAFVVIFFRIVLIPNNLVNIIFPPFLLLFTFWQWKVVKKSKKIATKNDVTVYNTDMIYAIVSFLAMVVATVVAWMGFTLLAVEVMVWWMFQLAAIQTITCIYDILSDYEQESLLRRIRKKMTGVQIEKAKVKAYMRKGRFINHTWLVDFVNMAIIPILCVISVLWSIYQAADVFEMTEVCVNAFSFNFIDQEMLCVSLKKMTYAVALFFIFRYVVYLLKSLFRFYKENTSEATERHNFTLANNVIAILIWGIYVLYVLVVFHVPRSGISIVGAGLATGMGFAMKDLLENFFYGISLMTGRIRVGDYVECDGIMGKVDSITYQSTQIVTMDGSIIAFLNSALFTKNFKNLTRQHNYILTKIPVGVGYGSDMKSVRDMIINAVSQLDTTDENGVTLFKPNTSVSVIFDNFGDNSLDLLVCTWVLVENKGAFMSKAREVIYNTLNDNKIEIPFPQRDVHIINP